MKKLTIDMVEFEIILHNEDQPVRGNAIASGDDKYDTKVENRIIKQLESGNLWAWCVVEVKATFEDLEASDYLGGCSYRNQRDFEKGGYYEDMKDRAFEALSAKVEKIITVLA